MLDPGQLAALAAVHRRGAFDLAATDLSVTPSAISQRIRALEERLGTVLIRRGQPARATEAGLRLIRHHDEIALMEHRLAQDLPALSPEAPRLRIAVNADSLATWVLPALAECPDFLFDLVIDDQAFSQDWLRRGEVLAAVTAHPGPLQGCDTLPLGALRYRATASPGFIARHFSEGVTREGLAHAPALRFNEKDRLQEDWIAAHLPGPVPALPSHGLASSEGFVSAARLGLGWGMNPEVLVARDLAEGRLQELRPDAPLDVALHWQISRISAPSLAPLTAAMKRAAKAVLV